MAKIALPLAPPAAVSCCGITMGEPLGLDAAGRLARGFAALGDPVRVRILSLISSHGEVCSCDLVEPLGKSQPTISHHTKVLAEAGLIVGEKKGKWTIWRLVPDQVDALRGALEAAHATVYLGDFGELGGVDVVDEAPDGVAGRQPGAGPHPFD